MTFPWRGGPATLSIFALGLAGYIGSRAGRTLTANDLHVRLSCGLCLLIDMVRSVVTDGRRGFIVSGHIFPWPFRGSMFIRYAIVRRLLLWRLISGEIKSTEIL